MMFTDILRGGSFALAGMTYALALANLVISFMVLRPRKWTWAAFKGNGGGFIWLHIVCVTIPMQGFVTWGISAVAEHLDEPLTWRPWVLAVLCSLVNVGYIVIYRVELSRLNLRRTAKSTIENTRGDA